MTLRGALFILRNWKLIVHLLLHTASFGVNNQWTVPFVSLLSSHNRGVRFIVFNYRAARFRAVSCGFLTREECANLGWKSEI